ncbi:MAG: thiamine diphosphokinase [Gammaproteobacteria bacterium]|nr:thiamine diphosphokinase [Gammaproteobacteria bacterium]
MVTPAQKRDRKTACICCNGELNLKNQIKLLASASDLLIAADGGVKHLASMNLKPYAIIGDMDSLSEDPWKNDQNIKRIKFSRDKDRSDTELAIEWAFAQGATHILLLAGTGGRFDHTLGNCALLIKYPNLLAMWDNGFIIRAVAAGQHVIIRVFSKALISIIPLAEHTRVKTTGLQYNLSDVTLDYATHGLSNFAVDEKCSITVNRGVIMLCVEGGDAWPN